MSIMSEEVRAQQIAKLLAGELPKEEAAELEIWKNSQEGQKEFKRYEKLWLNAANPKSGISEEEKRRSFRQTIEIIQRREAEIKPAAKMASLKRYFSIAAACLLFGALATFTYFNIFQSDNVLYSNDTQGLKTVQLVDGSTVHLKAGSSLKALNISKDKRAYALKGEAYFEVEKDPSSPFTLNTKMGKVSVLGTKFNVKENQKATAVHVTEGKVRFEGTGKYADNEPLTLTAGEAGKLSSKTGQLVESNFNTQNFLAWKTNHYKFEESPASQVFADLANTQEVSFRFSTGKLADCSFTAEFKDQSLSQILKTIERSFGWKISKDASGTYQIEGTSCAQ